MDGESCDLARDREGHAKEVVGARGSVKVESTVERRGESRVVDERDHGVDAELEWKDLRCNRGKHKVMSREDTRLVEGVALWLTLSTNDASAMVGIAAENPTREGMEATTSPSMETTCDAHSAQAAVLRKGNTTCQSMCQRARSFALSWLCTCERVMLGMTSRTANLSNCKPIRTKSSCGRIS